MYHKELMPKIDQKKKNKKARREDKSSFVMNLCSHKDFLNFSNIEKNHNSQQSRNSNALEKESFGSNFLSNKAMKRAYKLLGKKNSSSSNSSRYNYSRVKATQILKAVSALLLLIATNEALAFDLDAGTKAGLKPFYKWVVDWWMYIVGLIGCGMAMLGEGDLRVRSKTAGVGVICSAVVMLILIGAMGNALAAQ